MAVFSRRQLLVGGGTIAAVGAAGLALPRDPNRKTLIIAAMPPGTSWYVFGATLAQMLERQMTDTDIELFARGGGTGNPALVDRGRADVALSQVATALWAWKGQTSAYRGVQRRRIRALVGGLNSVWMTAVVREDYVQRTGRGTLEEILTGRPAPRIIMKPPGSTVPVVAEEILQFYGLDRDSIRAAGGSVLQVSINQIPDMIGDGRADLYFETAIKGHPSLTETATLTPVQFLDFSPALLTRLSEQGMTPRPLPAWFKGQTRPVAAVDCGTVLIGRDDLPDAVAYLITKTLCERRDVMVEAHRAWADFEPKAGGRMENTGIPLHPGSARYFKEHAWI
jgi:TRAP transporter TAXI family solute receptor